MTGGTDPAADAAADRATQDLMAERYGRRTPGRRRLTISVVVVGALVALGWLLWAAWVQSNPEVTGGLQSFDVVSEHQLKVVIQVDRDSGAAVTCTVEAAAADHGIVGDQTVTIPAGSSGTVTFEATIATDRLASAATVSDCH
jgi:hypothetical protein